MISKDTISVVRDRTDLVAVVAESVPSLKKRGRRFLGLCPFHKEKTPSFNVNPDTGLYHCFGCKESGDAFTFLQRTEGYSFQEAVRFLAERAGIALEEERGAAPSDADRHKKERDALYAALQLAAAWYEAQLREHPLRAYAHEELARRGLDPGCEAVQAFRVGYAPPGWDGLTSHFKRQAISPAVGESVGLLVARVKPVTLSGAIREHRDPDPAATRYYDRFRHRLMFAIFDVQGRVIAFSGRALRDPAPASQSPDSAGRWGSGPTGGEGGPTGVDDRPRDPPPKYINSPESPVYVKGRTLFGLWQGRHAIRQEERAILVEGNFDVVSLHARGVQNVVAPLGTAFTDDQAMLLHRYATFATLLFDGDAAGRKAARAAEGPCDAAGLDTKVAILPDGVDPDELVRKKGLDALRHVLEQARGLLEYLIDAELDESFNAADVREKAARMERVTALIARQKDPLSRGMLEAYADYTAGRLDLVRSAPSTFPALKRKILAAARSASARARVAVTPPKSPAHSSRSGDAHGSWADPSADLFDRRAAGTAPMPRSLAPGARPWEARIAPRPAGHEERKAIAGAILDFPALVQDPDVLPVLGLLEGNSARIVAAVAASLRTNARGEKVLDSAEFLAQMPPTIQAFASARLAAPSHETIDEAKETVTVAAKRLREVGVARETSEIVREQHRVVGDWETEVELARHADALVRRRFMGK
jgi:DNA primase